MILIKSLFRYHYSVHTVMNNSQLYRCFYMQTMRKKRNFDLVIIGGGIVGVASAREIILRQPALKIAILEKENKLAYHQSGHNSGVIHSGVYYKPGSLKAKLCVEGLHLIYKYLDKKSVPYKKCGKLIVATNLLEVERLRELYRRGKENGVQNLKLLHNENEIQNIEPYCEGLKALWSPETGIVDWAKVTQYYAIDFKQAGGEIFLNFKVKKFTESTMSENSSDYPICIHGSLKEQKLQARYVLTCGGLQSDFLAKKTGCSDSPRIVPIRGEYLILCKEKQHLINGNIYPVPDPSLPFLGVHITPRMDGSILLGPNAIPALKREGYRWSDINILELFNALRYPGFLKLAARNYSYGLKEMWKSLYVASQVEELQKFMPYINEYDVYEGPSGVRAQALSPDGNLIDDFVFDRGPSNNVLSQRVLHCRNAPSPGATSSLAIAKFIANKIEKEFNICT